MYMESRSLYMSRVLIVYAVVLSSSSGLDTTLVITRHLADASLQAPENEYASE
jgi:hypothetical protein